MSIFVDYIQPLTNWLHANPHWALLITFGMSLAESFAIIGSIVPGSVTMTAIGILAGSGIIRIDLTLIAAIFGAVCGDSLSYALGYFYSDRITDFWPFSKYPRWLDYGKIFFSKHGGKSVFLGRFVGPLRSIIPIIAGIMHMSHWRFFLANVTSAIGWSLLYILPGVMIGAASAELSAETATRLFIVILLVLAGIWLLSLFFKILFSFISNYLKKNLHPFWLGIKKHPILYRFFHLITPENEGDHYATVILVAIAIFAFLGFIIFVGIQFQAFWMNHINLPVYLLIKSFHTPPLKAFLIICTQFVNIITIGLLFLSCLIWFFLSKNKVSVLYLLVIVFSSALIAFIITLCVPFHTAFPRSSHYTIYLTIATAFYSFVYFYTRYHFNFLTNSLRTLLFLVLGFSGLGIIGLGDSTITAVFSSYCCGLFIATVHYLIYRKLNNKDVLCLQKRYSQSPPLLLGTIVLALVLSLGCSIYIHLQSSIKDHTASPVQHKLTEEQWWNQDKPILPLYLYNRIGKRINILNLQYHGSLDNLQLELEQNGWELHKETFATKLLQLMNTKSTTVKLSLLDLLFDNKRPELIMTYRDPVSKIILELRIWNSDYFFKDRDTFLWIGNIRVHTSNKNRAIFLINSLDPLITLTPMLRNFKTQKLRLETIDTTTLPIHPYILLIKQ